MVNRSLYCPLLSQGSGFALHVQQKEKQKMYHKQYPAAAQLIQAAWRVHATSRLHHDNATWRLYRLVDPLFGKASTSSSIRGFSHSSDLR